MYHIKNDKRIERSVERITQSLTACLGEKQLSEISVAEIAQRAGVSRATFYRIFDTPVDVLEYLCKEMAVELDTSLRLLALKQNPDYGYHVISFLINHADSLKAIFRAGRLDLLEKSIRPESEWIANDSIAALTDAERDYMKYSIAAILMSILYVWYEHGCKETAYELTRIFKKLRNEQNHIQY